MKPWLVHIEREYLDEWTIDVTAPDAAHATHVRGYNADHVEIEAGLVNHREEKMETWYFNDEPSAIAAAEHFARKMPGRAINVYYLHTVSRVGTTAVSTAKYTEKGLVP